MSDNKSRTPVSVPRSTRRALVDNEDDSKPSDAKLQRVDRMTGHENWHVWKAADRLEKEGLASSLNAPVDDTRELTRKVVSILRRWGKNWSGKKGWMGFLNKNSLLHEVEESIVSLESLIRWMDENRPSDGITIVDVCCGKGVFSLLTSYVFEDDPRVEKIIMLDKATINWSHVKAANKDASMEKRPLIELWGGCNLHEIDQVVDRLEAVGTPLALVGIHLCKTLSPTCIGIVNAMGPSRCPFLCLAPCCLPRVITSQAGKKKGKDKNPIIEVPQYETPQERKARRVARQRRDGAMKRGLTKSLCYLCKSPGHPIHKCGLLPANEKERIDIFHKAAAATPCWKCGVVGHFKADCPSDQVAGKPSLILRPMARMDVSTVIESDKPFDTYCSLLAGTIQLDRVLLIETGLVNNDVKHQEGNWNSGRKSIYIVATK